MAERPGHVSLSPRAWTALLVGFLVITAILALTAITLISQRQRTVLLNRQLGTLLGEATLVLRQAGPALDALPHSSSTVTTRAHSAAELVDQSRSLIADLRARGLPNTLSAAGQFLNTVDQPGVLSNTVAAGLHGLHDLDVLLVLQHSLITLQRQVLAVQVATLQNGRRTNHLTTLSVKAARETLAQVETLLGVARQTLLHVQSIDRKVGPVP